RMRIARGGSSFPSAEVSSPEVSGGDLVQNVLGDRHAAPAQTDETMLVDDRAAGFAIHGSFHSRLPGFTRPFGRSLRSRPICATAGAYIATDRGSGAIDPHLKPDRLADLRRPPIW